MYGYLGAHRVWGKALKLLPTRVRVRVRAFFTNAGMGKGTIVPYPLGTHCHPNECLLCAIEDNSLSSQVWIQWVSKLSLNEFNTATFSVLDSTTFSVLDSSDIGLTILIFGETLSILVKILSILILENYVPQKQQLHEFITLFYKIYIYLKSNSFFSFYPVMYAPP